MGHEIKKKKKRKKKPAVGYCGREAGFFVTVCPVTMILKTDN